MKLKRILLAAVAFGATALAITSCSKSEEETTASESTTVVSETPAETIPSEESKKSEEALVPEKSDPMINDVTEVNLHYDLDGGTTTSSTEDKNVTGLNSECFMYDVEKPGFNFRGWACKGVLVYDQFGVCQNTIKLESDMTFKAVYSNQAILTVESSFDGAGSVTGSGEYEYNSSVTVTATPKDGYAFAGWSYEGNLLSTQTEYKFQMWDRDATLTATFTYKSFNLTVESNNAYAGYVRINTAEATGIYAEKDTKAEPYKSEVTVSAFSLSDREFLGWYDKDTNEEITHNAVYTFRMPMEDYHLYAKWDNFELNFETNGGEEIADMKTAKMPAIADLPTPVKYNCIFDGWYLDDAFTKTPVEGAYLEKDTILYAKWIQCYSLSYDTDGGTAIESVNYLNSLPEELPETSKTGYSFQGWYMDKNLTIKAEEGKTITSDTTLYAAWYNRTTYTLIDSSTIYFGAYPQTHVTDTKITAKLTKLAGTLPAGKSALYKWNDFNFYYDENIKSFAYYIDLDTNSDGYNDYRGLYFTDVTQNGTDNSPSSSNMLKNGYNTNTVYWFGYDPIKWNINTVSNDSRGSIDSYALNTNMILDYSYFYHFRSTSSITHNGGDGYGTNYELSDIRIWLNDNFYNAGFSTEEQSKLRQVTVSNQLSTTNLTEDTYICNDTKDKVWILSYSTVNKYYTTNETRRAYATDYAKCLGIPVSTSMQTSGYLLRSPYTNIYVNYVYEEGTINFTGNYTNIGVRPCIRLKAY